jgi:universal stress protein E
MSPDLLTPSMSPPFSRLLLATEHTEYDRSAEALAFALARRCGLPLHAVLPLASNPEYEAVAPEVAARADAQAGVQRQALEAVARTEGVAFDIRVRRGAELHAQIVDEARERGSDLIVIRRRGKRGLLANLLVGDMVRKVITQAPCGVLVVPAAAQLWRSAVMVGVDVQQPAACGVARAAAVAAQFGLPLWLVTVAADEGARARSQPVLDEALAAARAVHDNSQALLRVGRVAETLIATAQERGADLLVLGRSGSAARAGIGSTAHKVVGNAACPVLVHVDGTESGAR